MEANRRAIGQAADEQGLDVSMRGLNPRSGGIGSPKSLTEEPDQRVGLTRHCRKSLTTPKSAAGTVRKHSGGDDGARTTSDVTDARGNFVFSAIDKKTLKFHTASATPADTNDPVAQNLGTHAVTHLFDSCFYASQCARARDRHFSALVQQF